MNRHLRHAGQLLHKAGLWLLAKMDALRVRIDPLLAPFLDRWMDDAKSVAADRKLTH